MAPTCYAGAIPNWPDSRTRTTTRTRTKHIVARSSEGRRYRKQPKIDALRQYKEEILEAHRSGLSVHRIAQIFRERGVDISVPHLVRTVRRFVDEEERVASRSPPRAVQRVPWQRKAIRNPFPKQRSQKPRSRTRFLNSPPPESRRRNLRSNCGLRGIWPREARRHRGHWRRFVSQERRNGNGRLLRRGGKATGKKAREEELAKERRRAGRVGHKPPASDARRGEKQRSGPGR